jgi:two-component system, OmpR family, phosphate regulon response regulator PhoB
MVENSANLILVVEDESEIRELLIMLLKRQGYQCESCSSASEAQKIIIDKTYSESNYSLIILDWMLPGMSGVEFLKWLRSDSNCKITPVLMVTAKTEAQDVIKGLDSGADDYVTKPFEPSVLMARVKAMIRRSKLLQTEGEKSKTLFKVGNLELNTDSHEVKCSGDLIHLTPSEFIILEELFKNQNKVLTREFLVGIVQGDGVTVTPRTIDTHVFGLRKKLGPCADCIETIRGVGYRLIYE